MEDQSTPTRRALLKSAGVVAGTAALGGVTYATTRQTVSQPPDTEWIRLFGGDQDATGQSIAQSDREFGVLSSNLRDSTDAVVKFSETGERTWTTFLDPDTQASTIAPSHDGGFLVGGTFQNDEIKQTVGRVVKIAPSGEIVWRQTYQGDSEYGTPRLTVRDIVKRPGGGYAFVGNEGNLERGALLVEIAEDGTTLTKEPMAPDTDRYREAKQSDDGVTYSRLYGLSVTEAGEYIVSGMVTYDENEDDAESGWVQRVDAELDTEWDYISQGWNFDILDRADDGFAVVEGEQNDRFGYTTLSGAGDVVGDDRYFDHSAETDTVVQRESGQLVLLGECRFDCDETILLGVGTNGGKIWEQRYSPEFEIAEVIATADGGLALVGSNKTEETDENGDRKRAVYVDKLGGSDDATATTPTQTATSTATETTPKTATGTATPTETAPETQTETDAPTRTATDSPTNTESSTETATATEAHTDTETASDDSTIDEDDCRI